jgi:hypothetical protein
MEAVRVLTALQEAVACWWAAAKPAKGAPLPVGREGGFGAQAERKTTPNAATPNFQSTPNLQLPKLPKLPKLLKLLKLPKLPKLPRVPSPELASSFLRLAVLEVGSWALIGCWELRSCGVDWELRSCGVISLT